MTTNVADAVSLLNRSFNIGKAAGWDPVGLQLGDLQAEAGSVAVCHEITPTVAGELLAQRVDLVVTYHPLLFNPTRALVAGSSASGRAFRLIAGGVAVYTVHTAYDVMPGGTADELAAALELTDISGFGPAWGEEVRKVVTFVPAVGVPTLLEAMAAAGAGKIGNYTHCSYRSEGVGSFLPGAAAAPVVGEKGIINQEVETRLEMIAPARQLDRVVAALVSAHPYEEPAFDVLPITANAGFVGRCGVLPYPHSMAELADLVGQRLGGVVRVAGDGSVETVTVVPGSGGGMLGDVATDAVVTGDVSHHQARDAIGRGIGVIDPGHAATERPGVRALYAAVSELFDDVIDLTDIDCDPWKER
jgi:dinuclear metal center YbgI/SA1388 family protein